LIINNFKGNKNLAGVQEIRSFFCVL